MERFDGKVAIVTGGGAGIGAAAAERLASEGCKVIVTGRRLEPIEKVATAIGGLALAGDAADNDHLLAAVELAEKEFDGLDILVNNAGTGTGGPLLELELDEWKRVLDLNLFGAINATRAAIPAMRKRGGGSIVNVSSVSSVRSRLGGAIYESSKASLNAMSRSFAVEFAPERIRSNCVCPGVARTELADYAYGLVAEKKGVSLEEVYSEIGSVYPMRRVAEAAEVGAVIAFLASDDASFVTGTELTVDGGGSALNVTTFGIK
ncbi:SDR family NAD(P)-dependent oxidoreductase [Congregibacter sp.]|uniref:SDR family NAD(P)-dependent oxidoreductase n=1 Tax=Congregibacter sp. TaxID=2744308 RepID=UPI00385B80AF